MSGDEGRSQFPSKAAAFTVFPWVTMCLVSCLPAPEGPLGEQVLASREIEAPKLTWAAGPASPLLLYDRPSTWAEGDPELWSLNLADRVPRRLAERRSRLRNVEPAPWGHIFAYVPGKDAIDLVVIEPLSTRHLATFETFLGRVFRDDEFIVDSGGAPHPKLTFGDGQTFVRDLDRVQSRSFGADGRLYFVRSSDHALARVDSPRGTVELLANNVIYFEPAPGGRHGLLATKVEGGANTAGPLFSLELDTLTRRPLNVPPSACRLLLDGAHAQATVACLEPAASDEKGDRVSIIDLATGHVGATFTGLVSEQTWARFSPDGSRLLILYPDTLMVIDVGTMSRRSLPLGVAHVWWSHDEQFLFLVTIPLGDAATAQGIGGRVLVWSAALLGEPVAVSPENFVINAAVDVGGDDGRRFLVMRGAVRRQNDGLFAVELAATGPLSLRQLGADVIDFSAGSGRVLAITGARTPDRTGRLMLFDLAAGTSDAFSLGVASFAVTGACPDCSLLAPGSHVTYLVRGREPLSEDGAWTLTLR
jgi:hypothetical protein